MSKSAVQREMEKLKAMGVTINVNSGGREPSGVSALIKEAAQDAGIYYEKEEVK